MNQKNAKDLTNDEKQRFCNALLTLKQQTEPGHVLNRYDEFVAIHLGVTRRTRNGVFIGDGAHFVPGFLSWHREYLNRFEKALQSVDPLVFLPYWDWSSGDSDNTTAIFTDDFIGPPGDSQNGGRITSGYFVESNWSIHPELDGGNHGNTLVRDSALLTTKLSQLGNFADDAQDAVYGDNDFDSFLPGLESPHGDIHMWVSGHMTSMSSPNDPVFFLHHANVDRLWSKWQELHSGTENYNPNNLGTYGSRLDDPMWPWDGSDNTVTIREGTATNVPLQNLLPTFSDYDVVTPRHVLDNHFTIPSIVKQFLENQIEIRNQTTGDLLTRYKIIGSIPDKFASSMGINDQILTTIGYEDRLGRSESDNDFVDVILEISHTVNQVNSLRGVQLGGDDIQISVNGTNSGNLAKTQDIPIP
ncbi:tyrosinase family protein [Nitrosopumilus sp. b2]|uniref:tyrosinase family protein n=1 Tax=Nitrosopumilus sp. b2 TaxID=2109908 RepID=UPI0015F35817|nr:tyrosinase family protein [Nitrosopumilus sp. b2]KAF6245118.1 tyrosinase [Nitrosopumilus sp. b2]